MGLGSAVPIRAQTFFHLISLLLMRIVRPYFCVLYILLGNLMNGQTTLEVQYYRPADWEEKSAESSTSYLLRCNDTISCFQVLTPQQLEERNAPTDRVDSKSVACWIYKDRPRQRILEFTQGLQYTPYTVTDSVPVIHWQIFPDTRLLNGTIRVQKARGWYGGRWYTAWFAPAIPWPDGPWKLGGLPGLILEASDEDKKVVFRFHSLRSARQIEIIEPPYNGRLVSAETHARIKKRELRQFLAYVVDRLQRAAPDLDLCLQFTNSFWEDPP